MSVGSMSVLSIYSAQFQHHVRRLLRRARRRQRRRSQRKRSRRRRHRVHTTRGDPTEKPTENATGKVHVRTREQGGRRAARSTKPRARAPACSLHYLVVGSPWRCPPCRLPLLRWRRLVPRQTKSSRRSQHQEAPASFPSPLLPPRRRFRRRVVNPGSSFASVAGGPSVPSATESTASAISTKGGACFFLPLSYLARRRRCVAV